MLITNVRKAFTPDVFKKLRTIKDNHELERTYSEILESVFLELGKTFKRNKHIYPDYVFDDGQHLEVKSTRTKNIKLNDSVPCTNVDYLIINLTTEKIILINGDNLITPEERDKLTKLKEAIKEQGGSIKGGRVSSYPRINLSLKFDWNAGEDQ